MKIHQERKHRLQQPNPNYSVSDVLNSELAVLVLLIVVYTYLSCKIPLPEDESELSLSLESSLSTSTPNFIFNRWISSNRSLQYTSI